MPFSKLSVKPKLNRGIDYKKASFEAIGTLWQISLPNNLEPALHNKLIRSIKIEIDQFDKLYSRFRQDSLISQIYQNPGTYHLPDSAKPMLDLYQDLYELSGGRVTPLIGQLMVDIGYDANYSLQPSRDVKDVPSWYDAVDYDFPKLTTKQAILLDFGALGKGYLVDLASQLIDQAGINNYVIDAGGDVKVRQEKASDPVRIGLEHPANQDEAIGVIGLNSGSLCGSAGNRRAWRGYNHIMNPQTRQPMQNLLASWARADSTMLADAMASSLYFIDAKLLKKDYDFEYAVVRPDYSLEVSAGFNAEFF